MLKRAVVGLLGLIGCADSDGGAVPCANWSAAECGQHGSCQVLLDDAGVPYCGDERIAPRSCDFTPVEDCQSDARCEVIEGRPLDASLQCIGAAEPVGCQQRGRSCPPAVLYAQGEGKTYEFARGCAPSGWLSVQPTSVPQTTCASGISSQRDASVGDRDASVPSCDADCDRARCDQLDVASCKLEPHCRVLKGWTYDPNMKCRGAEQELGCDYASSCYATPTSANDAQGRSYIFAESCLPAGYTSGGSTGLYDFCESGPPVDRCAGLTYQDCDAHPECRDGLGCPVTPTPPVVTGECEQRTIENCKLDSKCGTVQAQPLDAACNWDELVGCFTVGRTCHAQITYAKNASGRLFQFYTDDCLPPGFTRVDTASIPAVGTGACPVSYAYRCAALGVEHCSEDPGCEPVVGDKLDLTAHCIGAPVTFACAAKSQAREEVTAIAANRAGERYRLNGYRYVPEFDYYRPTDPYYSAATTALLAWPSCNP